MGSRSPRVGKRVRVEGFSPPVRWRRWTRGGGTRGDTRSRDTGDGGHEGRWDAKSGGNRRRRDTRSGGTRRGTRGRRYGNGYEIGEDPTGKDGQTVDSGTPSYVEGKETGLDWDRRLVSGTPGRQGTVLDAVGRTERTDEVNSVDVNCSADPQDVPNVLRENLTLK